MSTKSHLSEYLAQLPNLDQKSKVDLENSATNFANMHVATFTHQNRVSGLLFGQVQSGKTSQIFGVIAATADSDPGFKTFVLLTTNNINLQQQTLKRALAQLPSFNVCDESDDARFIHAGNSKPTLLILKKDTNVLKTWNAHLSGSSRLHSGPIFIIDDEADNASQNTKVNRPDESEIFRSIQDFRALGTSSIYLQVTATPQAILLQSIMSKTRPGFLHYFEPGPNYLGGDFFFTTPSPFVQVQIPEQERTDLLDPTQDDTDGLLRAVSCFLMTCADFKLRNVDNCNFLVHPSVGKNDHKVVATKIKNVIARLQDSAIDAADKMILFAAHQDLMRSNPNLPTFEVLMGALQSKVSTNVYLLNSSDEAERGNDFENGFNVIVGGNTLGRGVTFSKLQTVYYVRSARTPQADTYWQHSRMFGYDREPAMIRLFMPPSLFRTFRVIHEANKLLIDQLKAGDLDSIQVIMGHGVRPTRSNVLDQALYSILVGGTNYFPALPNENNVRILDSILSAYDEAKLGHIVSKALAEQLLIATTSPDPNTWPVKAFTDAIESLSQSMKTPIRLILRRDRDVSKDTGTLLSPTDRALGDSFSDEVTITAYRLNGKVENGWAGRPFWICNVKLPSGIAFHRGN